LDFQTLNITKAGVYLKVKGLYVFALGTKLFNGRIPIFRLGGHREQWESPWQCAKHEVKEETSLSATPINPTLSYMANGDDSDLQLNPIKWHPTPQEKPLPLVVVTYEREQTKSASVMYLAQSKKLPEPSAEVKGLVLLREQDIHDLSQKPQTLKDYLNNVGQAILKHDFDTSLRLEPFTQLRLLSKLLHFEAFS